MEESGSSHVPSVRIRTSNLSMSVKAARGRARNSNVVNAFTKCFEKRETYEKKLLNNINITFEPKEFTLLLVLQVRERARYCVRSVRARSARIPFHHFLESLEHKYILCDNNITRNSSTSLKDSNVTET